MAPHFTGGDTLLRGAADTFRTFEWLADDPRPLDWNGPADRLFTRFRDQDLQRPIIEHFEQVARRQRGRIAVRDANTALTFGELWDAVSGLAETLGAETQPGDLIGILLPAVSDVSARDPRVPRRGTPVCRTRYARSAGLARSRAAGCAPGADHHARGWRPWDRGPDATAPRHPSDGLAQTRTPGLATGHHGRGRTRLRPVHVRQHRAAEEHREQSAKPAAARGAIDQRGAHQLVGHDC